MSDKMPGTLIDVRDVRNNVADGEWVARQSSLGQLDICGLRLQLARATAYKNLYHTGSARAIGTAYHAGVERFYNEFHNTDLSIDGSNIELVIEACAETGIASYEAEATTAGDRFVLTANETHDENLGKVGHTIGKYIVEQHYLPPAEWEILGTEVTFWDQTETGQKVKGTIDLLARHKQTGKYRIEDHKTAGRPWPKGKESARKNVQAPFYFAYFIPAWCEAAEEWVDYDQWEWTYGVMSLAGKFSRRDGTPTLWHQQLIEMKVEKAREMIAADLFWPNPSSVLCSPKYCDHWEICPFGAAAEKN